MEKGIKWNWIRWEADAENMQGEREEAKVLESKTVNWRKWSGKNNN
jgi:hypothetical protein